MSNETAIPRPCALSASPTTQPADVTETAKRIAWARETAKVCGNPHGDVDADTFWNFLRLMHRQDEWLAAARAVTPLPQPDAALVEAPILWCVHHRGPDDLHPVESYEAAVKMADAMNESAERFNFGHKPDSIDYVWSVSYPAIWPGTAESHAEWMEKERANAALRTARQDGQTEGEG